MLLVNRREQRRVWRQMSSFMNVFKYCVYIVIRILNSSDLTPDENPASNYNNDDNKPLNYH